MKNKTDNQKRKTDPNNVDNLKGSRKSTDRAREEKGKDVMTQ